MLLFYVVSAHDPDLAAIADRGLTATDSETLSLWTTPAAAQPTEGVPVLVVDTTALDVPPTAATPSRLEVPAFPPDAICNLDPYRPPALVTAGGGYVACPLPDDVALLLIFRKGVWDLPKGKQDPGETIETCALREVREEVGIDDLRLLRPLGTTHHAYPDGEVYAVKTTHWYLMRTPERTFAPERREGIERVAWARWNVAREHIGYDTLRVHMDQAEQDVRTALSEAVSE